MLEKDFLPDPTFVFFSDGKLHLEYRNRETLKGVVVQCLQNGRFDLYHTKFDREVGAWVQVYDVGGILPEDVKYELSKLN